jgi:tRNA pseudouridine55 synthase
MAHGRDASMMDGLLIVDKPVGPTSHDVVARVRDALRERRVGHTGTLDPMASGVLPLVLGRATRLARFLSRADKRYEAVVRLGIATDTYDAEGAPACAAHAGPRPSRDAIERAIDGFRGTFLQRPPRFSAKKIGGLRSYRLARSAAKERVPAADRPAPVDGHDSFGGGPDAAGGARSPAAVPVTAHRIDLVSLEEDRLTLRVHCSAGFYVRSLAHDLGERLGIGAHLAGLRRTESGDATLADAVTLDMVEDDPAHAAAAVRPIERMLPRLAAVVLTREGVWRAGHGRDLGPADIGEPSAASLRADVVRLLDREGRLIGLAAPSATPGFLHPSVILR